MPVIPAKLVLAKAGSGNPKRHWIPGQARNDKSHKIYVVIYICSFRGMKRIAGHQRQMERQKALFGERSEPPPNFRSG